jgi:hypothetical protein
MNSDGGKLYMKIVAFDEIQFCSSKFFYLKYLHTQIIDILSG